MGSNSTQALGILMFLLAFTSLSGAFFAGGSMLWLLVFVVCLGISVALFLKAKPLEHQ